MKKEFLVTVLFVSLLSVVFCEDYVIAAEQFEYTRGQTTNAVTDATAELLPQQILSNINSQLMRSVMPDEQLERSRYAARQERYSLYLQLSSEYKKRDSLVLNNYSEKELKKHIEEQNKKIKEIEEKIQDNLDEQRKAEDELEKKQEKFDSNTFTRENTEKTELQKYSSLVKNLFVKDESLVSVENIKFYMDDKTALYTPNKTAKDAGYTSALFEKGVVNSNINALVTGKVTSYGIYCSVNVNVYTYPGAKLIGSVSEVGSKNELDFICSSISRQLVPLLTNSMKVAVCFEIEPKEAPYQVFIDDALQNNIEENLILDSGVHKIQIVAEGYKSVSTKYYFEGNEYYKIQALLELSENTTLHLTLLNPVPGTIYANSIPGVENEQRVSEIQINGSNVIGNFIDENGLTSFYYIPSNKINSEDLFYVKVDTKNRDEYIDLRRKWMYAGYSSLMVSLIPTFYTNGVRQKYAKLYNNGFDVEYKVAKGWETAWLACTGVSLAAGVFWGVELVRYLFAANTVLPNQTQIDKNGKLAEKQQKNIIKYEKELQKKAEKEAKKKAKEGIVEEEQNTSENEVLESEDESTIKEENPEEENIETAEELNGTEEEVSEEDAVENYKNELESRFKEGV